MSDFSTAKQQFDCGLGMGALLPNALVPVDGKMKANISLRDTNGNPLEEFYKWQFIYALLHSGLYAKDYIGVEVRSLCATLA